METSWNFWIMVLKKMPVFHLSILLRTREKAVNNLNGLTMVRLPWKFFLLLPIYARLHIRINWKRLFWLRSSHRRVRGCGVDYSTICYPSLFPSQIKRCLRQVFFLLGVWPQLLYHSSWWQELLICPGFLRKLFSQR